jgi:hypothetical protein
VELATKQAKFIYNQSIPLEEKQIMEDLVGREMMKRKETPKHIIKQGFHDLYVKTL